MIKKISTTETQESQTNILLLARPEMALHDLM